ncbi:MerR family transcriptional regulator [Virgisporangium aliadipatigenens]|uniref:MerR family transcriptional regulator n=1 Tax=Virgisporangium aliadipatigenens TaxID=741659 RepID=UPI0019428003|nr:MerR family transcriptional regulator [Virgisporangium aliadipatigenens]
MKSTDTQTIGDLAARFGLPTHVLRHWETMGLLEPKRDGAGRRRYGDADLEQVAMILLAKDAGFALRDIRALMETDDPTDRTDILERHVAALTERIARATAAKELIEEGMRCPLPFAECPDARAKVAAYLPPAK